MQVPTDDTLALEPLVALPLEPWEATRATLGLYVQVVGKIRLAVTPPRNHWWHVTLYVTATGLTTGRMAHEGRDFQIDFDFLRHRLIVARSTGEAARIELHDGLSVQAFHGRLMTILEGFGIRPDIDARPYRSPYGRIPFETDDEHASYDAEAVVRYWRALRWVDGLLTEFAGRFRGKQSPVHLFWHSFDLALTRFSGRLAPPRADADHVTRTAYDEELISVGFWPGDPTVREATLYGYAAPEPEGLASVRLEPEEARWVDAGSGHLAYLSFEAVRTSPDPHGKALTFLESLYSAAARAAGWDVGRLAAPWVSGQGPR